jgi:hypothetical protein
MRSGLVTLVVAQTQNLQSRVLIKVASQLRNGVINAVETDIENYQVLQLVQIEWDDVVDVVVALFGKKIQNTKKIQMQNKYSQPNFFRLPSN